MNFVLRFSLIIIVRSIDVKSSYVREGKRSLIVGGNLVDDADKYPYMANANNCGAVLVARNVFLTAAHCKAPLRVVMGKDYSSASATRRKLPGPSQSLGAGGRKLPSLVRYHNARSFQVIDVRDHPEWPKPVEDDSKSYDFRLLRISGYSDEDPIDLDNPDEENGYTNTDELLTIMGWGKTGEDEELSEDLREADVNVIDFETCKQAYQDDTDLDENVMFCAGKSGWDAGDTEPYPGTCVGDSGGPIVKHVDGKDVLVGIVSFAADECGNFNHPTVFAKVNSNVYDWIIDTINYWDCHQDSEESQGIFSWVWSWGAPHVEESAFEIALNSMTCAYILDDTTIRQAVELYIRKPNIATLVYSDPKYWDTTQVTNMYRLFYNAASFDQDISRWDMVHVTDTHQMFAGAASFNQDLSQWDMSKDTYSRMMFYKATSFNQDLSQWDMSEVYNSYKMFEGATSFNQNLCSWISNTQGSILVATNGRMFIDSSCPYEEIRFTNSVCQSCIS